MLWIKSCPRCKGDLFPENDSFCSSIVCLQCGHRIYLSQQNDFQSIIGSQYTTNLSIDEYSQKEDFHEYSRVYAN